MTCHRLWVAVLFASLVPLLAACGADQSAGSKTGPSRIDAAFVARGSAYCQEELRLARLAQTNAAGSDVRAMAEQLGQVYGAAGRQIASVAQAKGMPAPAAIDAADQADDHELPALRGAAFDRAYIDRELQHQTMAIQAFQAEADSGTDPQLRSVAQQALPALLDNLRTAQQLSLGR